uniref:Uncharacterized protein n=1 Tax=Ciona savignyi TaxID=51511 RepID=H2Z1H9_CIOSA
MLIIAIITKQYHRSRVDDQVKRNRNHIVSTLVVIAANVHYYVINEA